MIEKKHCLKCGHRWFPRIEGEPVMCPQCRNRNWNKEKPKEEVMAES